MKAQFFHHRGLAVLLAAFLLSGCVTTPQEPISLQAGFYDKPERTVGVYVHELPKPTTTLVGAGCLLCIALAKSNNSELSTHLEAIELSELDDLAQQIADRISRQGLEVRIIDGPVDREALPDFKAGEGNFPRKDYRELRETLAVESAVFVFLDKLGAFRPYNGYIPTSDPVGYVGGEVFIVDLDSNAYQAYEPIDIQVAVDGEWKEPPAYPGVTSAFYQAVEETRDRVLGLYDD